MSTHTFIPAPPYRGYWLIPDGTIKVATTFKPSLWKRFWVSVFFDAEWFEYKNPKP